MYLARVKAGHDRNQYYVVQSQDEKFVYLVNGTTRTCDRPRKKSYKHVQLVKKLPQEVLEAVNKPGLTENAKAAKLIKAYEQYILTRKDSFSRRKENVKGRCN